MNRTRRTGCKTVGVGEYNRRFIVQFGEPRSHDADYAFVPIFVVNHNRLFASHNFATVFKNLACFLGDLLVEFFSVFVVLVDVFAFFNCVSHILGDKQVNSFATALHATRGIDARTDFENHIANGDFFVRKPADANDAAQTNVWVRIDSLKTKICHHTVFAHNWHYVGSNAHCHQVEKAFEVVKVCDSVADGEGMHKFVANATARKILERIGIAFELRVENGNSVGQHIVGHMVVADDEVDAFFLGILNLFDCLDSAIEHNNQLHSDFGSVVDTFH